jgi:hypothetical protein
MVGPSGRFSNFVMASRYSWVLFWLRLSPQRHPGCPKAFFQERVAVVSIPGAAIGKPGGPALPRGVQSAELPVLELKRVDHPSIDSQRDNYWGRASDRRGFQSAVETSTNRTGKASSIRECSRPRAIRGWFVEVLDEFGSPGATSGEDVSSGRQSSPGCVTRSCNFDCRFRFLFHCFHFATFHRNHLVFRICC